MSSYQSAPAQRVPAWKRLGLKLKGPASGESPLASSAETANPTDRPHAARVNGSPASVLKRKPVDVTTQTQTPSKRLRIQDQTPASRKSVAFAEDTKPAAPVEAKKPKKDKPKKKKPKKAAADAAPQSDTNIEPSLAYLRQWHTDRASWKFNKNHQTLLIKYLFDADKVPSTDISLFYQYIRDLKGFVRTRLREAAEEIKKNDMEQGAGGFPAPTKNKEDKQKTYDDILSEFVNDQIARQNASSSSGINANGKRSFDEVELAIRLADPVIKQRLLKRIRAEMVIEELSDNESTTSAATTTTTASSSSAGKDNVSKATEPTAKRTESRTESQQPTKRRRLRKVRTNANDDSSSDSSSSDLDSSSDDESGSDKDSSEDEKMGGNSDGEGNTSSSSESSESGSDAEEEEADGNESESSESSSSSDDE
ncbi:hypothetical protein B0T18DRAFT_316015 [Schizothecium vesticola]|uniref:WKF domain-containing protein n=1 Tax=Schizothecium vesticola TaxID=314040 RepID=A0AA40FC40_9PEZI|nr:hypothetical protein B0T18DRAFT_316015 [Schizothecium vesticola]